MASIITVAIGAWYRACARRRYRAYPTSHSRQVRDDQRELIGEFWGARSTSHGFRKKPCSNNSGGPLRDTGKDAPGSGVDPFDA